MIKISFLLFLLFGSILASFLVECASVYGLKTEETPHARSSITSMPTIVNENVSQTNSTGKSWHTVETWSISLTLGASFSFFDFLRLLRDNSDKLNDDLDRICTYDTIRNIRNRICKKLLKFWKRVLNAVTMGKRFRARQ